MDKIKIATGRSRFAKTWKNISMTWEEFCQRLATTTRTTETVGEYTNLPKGEKDRIKDVGGFVGGVLKEGKRSAQTLLSRSILTLDADFATPEFRTILESNLTADYVVYSTHKHTPEKPRLRVIVRLNREVTPEEYQAVSRKVAEKIGINYFDDSTYEPSRLMYWPSTSIDGEYEYYTDDLMGPLNVDAVLAEYYDWRDVTQWPVSDRVDKARISAVKKQGDPLEKNGVIGAFCRTYDIHQAIERFIPDVYADCGNGRYTYLKGSTTAGLVTYDDKFAYSNHGTDPAGQKLCNAWDLVRIHLFGDRDEDAAEGTPSVSLPSYQAMQEMAQSDPDVKQLIITERIENSREAFAGVGEDDVEDDKEWYSLLEMDSKNRCLQTIQNVLTILEHDPRLNETILFNEFSRKTELKKNTPWRKVSEGDTWTDLDDSGLRNYIENVYGIAVKAKIEDGFNIFIANHSYHPVRDYLGALVWDGAPRVETLLVDYLGADEDAYTRAVTRKTLVAAVARVMRPGVKFDFMLTLIGPQGLGKSTLIKKLGMDWFTDSISNVSNKDALEQLQGFWICEMGELTALKRAEEEQFKQFLSKSEDSFRKAYGRRTEVYKRQCIFIGTTNQVQFLRDRTGNRRFWPVNTRKETAKSVFVELTRAEVDQIWAEAKTMWLSGETLYLDRETEKLAIERQTAHMEESPYARAVDKYINMEVPENWSTMEVYDRRRYYEMYDDEIEHPGCEKISKICALMVWQEALGGDAKNLDRTRSKELNDLVRGHSEWSYKNMVRLGISYGMGRGFVRENR